jgi:isocitrate dehydrogenase (NAD+)
MPPPPATPPCAMSRNSSTPRSALLHHHQQATPLVIPSLNRDGDLLSDLVLQMFGSIAGSESMVISLNQDGIIDCVMAEAPHGTAPSLEGKNVANPMAMILAAAGLLGHMDEKELKTASRAIYEATLEAVYDGVRTADLTGSSATDQFTNEVIRRVKEQAGSLVIAGLVTPYERRTTNDMDD